jgi:hypothetical protein
VGCAGGSRVRSAQRVVGGGYPAYDLHGDPTPVADGTLELDDSFPRTAATTGQRVGIFRVDPEDGYDAV